MPKRLNPIGAIYNGLMVTAVAGLGKNSHLLVTYECLTCQYSGTTEHYRLQRLAGCSACRTARIAAKKARKDEAVAHRRELRSKAKADRRAEFQALHAAGIRQREIADMFGLSKTRVSQIIAGKYR